MLTKLQIFAEVKKILIESNLGFIGKNQIITPFSNLYDGLCMDSFDILEFIMAIENHFGISVSNDDIANIATLSDICACVQKELLNKQENMTKPTVVPKQSLLKRIFTKTR